MTMMNYILFLLVILLTNIIQGITGFAGTILAMPPGLMLVGYPEFMSLPGITRVCAGRN